MTKKRGRMRTLRNLLEYALLRLVSFLVRPWSPQGVRRLGGLLGDLAFRWGGRRNRVGMTNLDIAFGESKTRDEKIQILKQSYRQLATSALQCLWLNADPEKRMVQLMEKEPEGLEVLKRCLDKGKGVFFLTAHYGNWEALGLFHGYLNVSPLYSIVRRLDNPFLEEAARTFRTVSGNGLLYREESPLKIVKALKNNHCVAVMMDQNTAVGAVFVDFFGKAAATPRSVALLSYRLGTPIVPLFAYPTDRGTYQVVYGPELRLEKSTNKDADVIRWTQECEKFIESVVREKPEYWMWIHRRWKTRPPEDLGPRVY